MTSIDRTAHELLRSLSLVASNDEPCYRDWQRMAVAARTLGEDEQRRFLADNLKDWFENAYAVRVTGDEDGIIVGDDSIALVLMDVLGTVRDSIDWWELAGDMLDGDYGEEWAGMEDR